MIFAPLCFPFEMVPAQASNPNSCLHGSCVSRRIQLGVLSPASIFSQSAYPLSDTAVRTANSDHLHQTGVSTAGLEPASPRFDSRALSLRSLPRVGIFPMVSATYGTSNLKYVDITLYPSFQGPTSVLCFVDEVLPLNGSHREPRKTRGSNPQPFYRRPISNRLANHSPIFLAEKAPGWRFPSQLETGVRPILRWVYTNARGLRVWTPEHAPQHPLCPSSGIRTRDLNPAIGKRSTTELYRGYVRWLSPKCSGCPLSSIPAKGLTERDFSFDSP